TAPGPGTPSTGGRELTAAPPVIDRGRLPCRSRHRYLVYSLRPGLPGIVYRHAMAFGELSRGGPLPGVVRGGGGGGELRRADRRRTHRCAEVTWYTRHPPRWMPDEVDGRVLFRRNRQRALAVQRGETDPGADSELGDIVVLPEVRAARDAGWLAATPMFNSLNEVRADHLIWCTGFRPSLGPV